MQEIKYIDRESEQILVENIPSQGMLKWLYSTAFGKVTLNILFKRKLISALGGWYMNTCFSKKRIRAFVQEHNIKLEECEISNPDQFKSFNHFFCRKLKENARSIGNAVVSPADGKILVFSKIDDISSFFVKNLEFSLKSFLRDEKLANKYNNGAMAIVRLAPPDYHRYHFPASGKASESVKIKGHYFSVSPLALKSSLRIFCENKREYCTLSTRDYGDILIVDIGATMVGSIVQTYQSKSKVKKGDEKGYFAFGGSTLVLLFEENKILFDEDLIYNTQKGLETYIRMGENIAQFKRN